MRAPWRALRPSGSFRLAVGSIALTLVAGLPAAYAQPARAQTPNGTAAQNAPDGERTGTAAGQRSRGTDELRLARATGKRVEVTGLRTTHEQVFAQPNGRLASEITAGPRFAQRPDGSWGDIDTRLETKPNGAVGPRLALVDVEFSGGGADPLVAVADAGRSAALTWPGRLPRPVLKGSTATYRDVLPGTDLTMRATAEGFRQVLVVRTAAAARNPELRKIRLAKKGDGLRFTENTAGGLAVQDGTGRELYSGGEPLMWDSGSEAAVRSAAAPAAPAVSARAAAEAATGGNDPLNAPLPGDKRARVRMDVDATSVTLVPDAALLRAEDTAYPVYIDPPLDVEKPSKNGSRSFYTWASSGWPSQTYPNFDDSNGVGRCTVGCSFTSRMYFEYDLGGWEDRTVYKATFSVYETFSYSCTPTWVDLHLVDAAKLSKSTNWNNKPANGDLMVDRKVAYGNERYGCENATVNFSDNAEETNENLTKTVRAKADAGEPIAFALAAKDEGAADGWKQFKGDSGVLSIEYNTKPEKPSGERTTGPTTACATGAARPYIAQDSPDLTVDANDKDAHNIKVLFRAWEDVPDPGQDVQVQGDLWTAYKAQGGAFSVSVPSGKLKHGSQYQWHAQAYDGIEYGPWSDWCEFQFDNVKPDTEPAVTPPADIAQLTPGQTGLFRFGANGNQDPAYGNDVDHYLWGLNTDTPATQARPAALGGEAVDVPVQVVKFGINVLRVRSVDRAGNAGPVRTVEFQAGRACADPPSDACAAAAYKLDENTGTAAGDAGRGGNALPLTGAGWAPGNQGAANPADTAVRLNGTSGSYGTRASLVDSRQGLTVMAWVRPTDLASGRAVLSQSGAVGNGFVLYYSPTGGWTFARHRSATGTDEAKAATGRPQDVTAGQWVHVAGTFDPSKNQIDLFVNGDLVASEAVVPSIDKGTALGPDQVWHADRGFQLGRAMTNGALGANWAGDIDDARVYPAVLDRSDIFALSQGG